MSQPVAAHCIMHSGLDIVLCPQTCPHLFAHPNLRGSDLANCGAPFRQMSTPSTCSSQSEVEHYPCARPNTQRAIKRHAMIKDHRIRACFFVFKHTGNIHATTAYTRGYAVRSFGSFSRQHQRLPYPSVSTRSTTSSTSGNAFLVVLLRS